MKKYIIISLSLILFLLGNTTIAQINDFEVWTTVAIKKELSDRIDISFSEEARFNENASRADKIFSDIGVSYKLNYKFAIGAYYRFINAREINSTYSKEHRYYFDLSYTERLDRLKISNRLRFQSKYSNMFSSEWGLVPSNYLRDKISAEYDLKNTKFNPATSVELYYRLNGKQNNIFNRVQYTVGTEYELSKKSTIEVYFRLQKEFNEKNPVTSYILGLTYSYKL